MPAPGAAPAPPPAPPAPSPGRDNLELAPSPCPPSPGALAFTVELGSSRPVDRARLEALARRSRARHRLVHSAPAPARKAHGYNSEGYFSSDQEDSVLSGSVPARPRCRGSPASPALESPVLDHGRGGSTERLADSFKIKSKSPIVDSIMTRSDTLPSRRNLNLPLKAINSSSYADVHDNLSYSMLPSSYSRHNVMADIIDQSPDGLMLTDISSPDMDMLTPDNALSSPEAKFKTPKPTSSPARMEHGPEKDVPVLFRKCAPKHELEILEDCDRHSESSAGTYTIEGDNYTEEQKARMSIDRTFGVDLLKNSIKNELGRRSGSKERDPELILDLTDKAVEYRPNDVILSPRSPLNRTFELPKVSTDKNVLEISCCYESPTETDLAQQTSKQIKSTRNYLEKIKSRVRTISEKTFQKASPKCEDEGSFTSVTTSGVLSAKLELNYEPRRMSLSKSQVDKTDYVHRLSRESSVPVSLPSSKKPLEGSDITPEKTFDGVTFESEVLRNAHAKTRESIKDDSGISDVTPEQVVGKLSYLSLNRCKGDKTWIQEWADSVKKYNSDSLGKKSVELNCTFVSGSESRPPASPRHQTHGQSASVVRNSYSAVPTKIPSPVHLRHPVQDFVPGNSETESYLLRTQNAITNLQAKLHNKVASPISNIPPLLTSSLISEKTAASRLPVSQLSRSNSLNYRLRRRDPSTDNSPLRSPGNYVITGSTGIPSSTKLLIASTSRSLDTEPRINKLDSNMNSPDRSTISHSSEEKTLSNRTYEKKGHTRHKSFEGRNPNEYFSDNNVNALGKVSLKTVLKNNAFEAQRTIEPTRCQGNRTHVRVYSDQPKIATQKIPLSSSIRRSSSFSTVNRNNNYIEPKFKSSNQSANINNFMPKDTDYLSDESDNGSYDVVKPQPELRMNRAMILRRERLEAPNIKSLAPVNSPRCPNTPEMQRKFGPGLARSSSRVINKGPLNSRMSEPPRQMDREKTPNQQGRKISDTTRQDIVNRLTKSRSSTRDFQPKPQERGNKKPNQHRSSTSLASKEVEFTNWKKRSSYDPMKAAREGRRRQTMKKPDCNKDDLSSPSHSSPVHRSQSFHSTNMADLETLDYSSEETEDDQIVSALPMEHPMISSTHSDILELRRKGSDYRESLRRQPTNKNVVLSRDYVANLQINQPLDRLKFRRDADKRKTFIIDDTTPTRENMDLYRRNNMENTFTIDNDCRNNGYQDLGDKRKTFILDSDNSTTNTSPRTSSIFTEKHSLTTPTSDTDVESETDVVARDKSDRDNTRIKRHSGDFSVSSASSSQPRRSVQPRYLDISAYRSADKSRQRGQTNKNYIGAQEAEQRKQELEKWKRRASYDPRKAAAQSKTSKTAPKTVNSVLRSQSFHGPVLSSIRYTTPHQIAENYDQTSDNDF